MPSEKGYYSGSAHLNRNRPFHAAPSWQEVLWRSGLHIDAERNERRGVCNSRFRTVVWLVQVIASFRNLTGRDPEMVVFASNFWDIASWGTRNASILDTDDLEDWVMDDFNQNMSHVLSTIEVSQPPWQSPPGRDTSAPPVLLARHAVRSSFLTCMRSAMWLQGALPLCGLHVACTPMGESELHRHDTGAAHWPVLV